MDGKTRNEVMTARWYMLRQESNTHFYAHSSAFLLHDYRARAGRNTPVTEFWSEGKSQTNTDARKIIIQVGKSKGKEKCKSTTTDKVLSYTH